jgi:hypothetical protein
VIAGRIEIIQRGYQISVIGYRKDERSSPLRTAGAEIHREARHKGQREILRCARDDGLWIRPTSERPQKAAPTKPREGCRY